MFMQTDLIVCREAGFWFECAVILMINLALRPSKRSFARPEAVANSGFCCKQNTFGGPSGALLCASGQRLIKALLRFDDHEQ
jgi:hypothetical protein